ncbi:hypothetical protein A2U01_0104307 [Trifolium medium]|uniref:Uncharacterized protein n=1 Tax=Trifolium medium TaxID=97028 RepID=A0A392V6E7_9FABA|nr:hypothetical protein [Trifolium medium]
MKCTSFCAQRSTLCAQLRQEHGEYVLDLPSALSAAPPEPGAGHYAQG